MSTSTQATRTHITFAVVGYEPIEEAYVNSLAQIPDVGEIVVVEPREERRDHFMRCFSDLNNCVVYPDLAALGAHPAPIQRGIVATQPEDHIACAEALLDVGADVLVETGGKSLAEVHSLVQRANRAGLTIGLPLDQFEAWARIYEWLRSGAGGKVLEEGYTSLMRHWFGAVGPIEDRGMLAIASALETVGQWTMPSWVRARPFDKRVPDLEVLELYWGPYDDPETPRSRALLGADRRLAHEMMEVKRRTERGLLITRGRTTHTPPDRAYPNEFISEDLNELVFQFPATERVGACQTRVLARFVADPGSLPVVGRRMVTCQAIYDVALTSLANGGEFETP